MRLFSGAPEFSPGEAVRAVPPECTCFFVPTVLKLLLFLLRGRRCLFFFRGFLMVFFFFPPIWWWCIGSLPFLVHARSLLPSCSLQVGLKKRRSLRFSLDRCGTLKLSSGRSLSRARRGTDIHGEWRPLFSFCQRAPRLSSPPFGGVWKAGVRLSGLNPVNPRTCRCGSWGSCDVARLPLARLAWSAWSPSPDRGRGWPVCRAACPSRLACARVSLAILAVLLERSRLDLEGARF